MTTGRERDGAFSRRRPAVRSAASQADNRGSTPRDGTRTIPEWWDLTDCTLGIGVVHDSAMTARNDIAIFAEQRLSLVYDLRPTPPRP